MSAGEWAALPAPCVLEIFTLAESSKDAAAWRLACKAFFRVCGKVDMLQLRVLGNAKAAVSELDASSRGMATWFGLDLDFAPMELVQQGRMTSPFVLQVEQAKLVEVVMKHLHGGIRWARLAEPASFCLPYHLRQLSAVVTLELVLNPAVEEVVFASAAFQHLHCLRRLTLRGRLPQARRRMQRRALPHVGPSVAHLAAHGLNLTATDWAHLRHVRSLDLSHSDVRLGPYCGGLLSGVEELALRGSTLDAASPAVFEGMAALRRLDMQGCSSSRAGSWLSRVLGSSPDTVALPGALRELRALGCNVFDRCALELGGAAALTLLELPSGVQLPATLKHAPPGLQLGLHVAEEGHVVSRHGRDSYCIKACLASRLPCLRRLWGCGLGRGALGALRELPELRELRLLAGDRRRLALDLDMPALEAVRVEGYQLTRLRLPVCLHLHTAVLVGQGACVELALPPSTLVLVLDGVMRDPRTLALATMVPRLRTAVLGMGHLPASLPPTVQRLAVVGPAEGERLAQAYRGLQALLPQLPQLEELRVTSGEPLPDAVAALLPPGCQFSTGGVPQDGGGVDRWGRSLHQTAQLRMAWCESLLTLEGLDPAALLAEPGSPLLRQVSRVLVS